MGLGWFAPFYTRYIYSIDWQLAALNQEKAQLNPIHFSLIYFVSEVIMKPLFSSVVLALLINASAFSISLFVSTATPKSALEIQLAKQITYPAAMLPSTHGEIVIVQFQLDQADRLTAVQVQTDNAQLNAELTRQLTGMKVSRVGLQDEKRYTVQIRFWRTI